MQAKHAKIVSKRRKKSKRLKVVSFVLAPVILISSGLAALKIKDKMTDHLHEACTFSKVCTELHLDIGWKHLIKEIEKNDNYTAYHQLEKETNYYRHSERITVTDGYYHSEEIRVEPGYELLDKPYHGFDCHKTEYEPEAVVILDSNKKLVRKLVLK